MQNLGCLAGRSLLARQKGSGQSRCVAEMLVSFYCISQIVESLKHGRSDAQNEQRTVRFTVYDYLMASNQGSRGNGLGY